MAVIQHPDMPKTLLGIQGLNLWNLLLAVVRGRRLGVARGAARASRWDLPRGVAVLLGLYCWSSCVSFVRLLPQSGPARRRVHDGGAS